MIQEALPPGVASAETWRDDAVDVVFPGEESSVGRQAAPKRRREFIAARQCAREALTRLGLPPIAIPSGPRRAPCWPAGVVGSITHCVGYRAAAVAPLAIAASIGIDAEPHAPLPEGVIGVVVAAADRAELARLLRTDDSTCWDRLLFSAKESVFKAWFPLTGRWLGFEDAAVTFDEQACTFRAQLLVPGPRRDGASPLTTFSGRWLVRRELVITTVAVPADEPT